MLVRNLVGVVTAIAVITTVGLWLGQPNRQSASPTPRAAATPVSQSPADLGARLYEAKGCVACHSSDGSQRVGPTFKGAFGSDVELTDGVTLRFDEAYVRESLSHPQAKLRAGYPPSMPSFDGMLTPREVDALVAFLASLR